MNDRVPSPEHRAPVSSTPEPPPSSDGLEPFRPVSPLFARSRLVSLALVAVPILVALLVLALLVPFAPALTEILVIAWVVLVAWAAFVLVRQVPRMGYQRRPHDLLIEHGIMFRRSTLVPYGRMQFVEVIQGPVDRRFGLAGVQLHTASPHSDAAIVGLPRADADALRDLLADRGEADLAGL